MRLYKLLKVPLPFVKAGAILRRKLKSMAQSLKACESGHRRSVLFRNRHFDEWFRQQTVLTSRNQME